MENHPLRTADSSETLQMEIHSCSLLSVVCTKSRFSGYVQSLNSSGLSYQHWELDLAWKTPCRSVVSKAPSSDRIYILDFIIIDVAKFSLWKFRNATLFNDQDRPTDIVVHYKSLLRFFIQREHEVNLVYKHSPHTYLWALNIILCRVRDTQSNIYTNAVLISPSQTRKIVVVIGHPVSWDHIAGSVQRSRFLDPNNSTLLHTYDP